MHTMPVYTRIQNRGVERGIWMSDVANSRRENNRWHHKTVKLDLKPGDKVTVLDFNMSTLFL